MFEKILVEEHLKNHERVQSILKHFERLPVKYIRKTEDYFGRVKKPYLQKRQGLQLFLGEKKGQVVKLAPDAYGVKGHPHYYFIHAYNCIYECEYCYLQGYFDSPDIVLFVNHEDIAREITTLSKEATKDHTVWFHAGEFSDSLALSHISGEIPFYFDLFKNLPHAKLELRTKSANIKELLKVDPLPNIITSYSLSPQKKVKSIDHKTPPLKIRLKSMQELAKRGHRLGIHLDPIIFDDHFQEDYEEMIKSLLESLSWEEVDYISIGVIRFSQDVYQQLKKNYPKSHLLASEFIKGHDGKIRYPRPMRMWILSKIKDLLLKYGLDENKLYVCMD